MTPPTLQHPAAGGGSGDGGGKTVVVGVKMDAQSRELLTWSLVKMAQPGDLVIALHVLGTNGNSIFSIFLGLWEEFMGFMNWVI